MRTSVNFAIDLVSALVLIALAWTGLVMSYLLPPGTGGRMALWGIGRHDWGDVHFWLASTAVALLIVHVAMHWNWVCLYLRKRHASTPTRLWMSGLAFLVLLTGAFGASLWFANGQITPQPGSHEGSEFDAGGDHAPVMERRRARGRDL